MGGKEGVCSGGGEASLVQVQGPGEERTEKHPIRDPLAGAGCRLQAQVQASRRHGQANAN